MQQSAPGRTQTPTRASVPAREQRAGTKFTGGFGKKTGDSGLLFLEGQLPTTEGVVGVPELLGGASVQLDAIAAIE